LAQIRTPQILAGPLKQTNVILNVVHQIQHPIFHLSLHQIRIKRIKNKFSPHPTAFNHFLKKNLIKNCQMTNETNPQDCIETDEVDEVFKLPPPIFIKKMIDFPGLCSALNEEIGVRRRYLYLQVMK